LNILLTNDDGIQAEGLQVLLQTLLSRGHQVEVAAPDRERSAASQSLTITRPLLVRTLGPGIHSIDGTPADCVHLAVLNLVQVRPDLVISGMNWGLNVGDNIFYSGTVAAAAEALHLGVPALAVSRDRWNGEDRDLTAAARFTARLAEWWHGQRRWCEQCLLNVNFPLGSFAGARFTVQGVRTTHTRAKFDTDPMGRSYYWAWSNDDGLVPDPQADFQAVNEGVVSLTPLKIERTHLGALEALRHIPPPVEVEEGSGDVE
jgi:5'-nucleotidase